MINVYNYLLNTLGNASSLIALVLTICVFFTINKIKNRYIFKGRIPKLKKQFSKKISDLNKLLADDSYFGINRNEILLLLTQIHSDLQYIKHSTRNSTIKIKPILKNVNKINNKKTVATHQNIFEIYVTLRGLENDISNELEQDNWR